MTAICWVLITILIMGIFTAMLLAEKDENGNGI